MADEFVVVATITTDQIYTATRKRKLKIEAFGASGKGGAAVAKITSSSGDGNLYGYFGIAATGGSGGSGGYSCSIVEMDVGDTITIQGLGIGKTLTCSIDSSFADYASLVVTAATNGSDAYIMYAEDSDDADRCRGGSAGIGGKASGGQTNINGKNGTNGQDIMEGTSSINPQIPTLGGPAGAAAVVAGGNAGGSAGSVTYGGNVSSPGAAKASFVRISETANEAATDPGVPASAEDPRAGQNWPINWEASFDPDGDEVTYIVERAFDSDAFVEVGTTKDNSFEVPIPAPIRPGDVIPISWEAVSGADGYAVERSINGGAWEALVTTSKTTHTDTAPSSNKRITIVKYRVACVVNGVISSDYTESADVGVYVSGGEN